MKIGVRFLKKGKSKATILPEQVTEQLVLGDRVTLKVELQTKTPTANTPRQGWVEALAAAPPEALNDDEQAWLGFEG